MTITRNVFSADVLAVQLFCFRSQFRCDSNIIIVHLFIYESRESTQFSSRSIRLGTKRGLNLEFVFGIEEKKHDTV